MFQNKKEVTRLVIIGGGAGGVTCAVRARRISETTQIFLFEKSPFISVANCGFPYYIEGVIKSRDQLIVRQPEFIANRFNIEVRVRSNVTTINREKKVLYIEHHGTEQIQELSYDKLVVACGSEAIRPNIEGIRTLRYGRIHYLRSLENTDFLYEQLNILKAKKPEGEKLRVGIIGGGYIGIELTEALVNQNCDVSLIEAAPHVMTLFDEEMVASIHRTLLAHSVNLKVSSSVQRFVQNESEISIFLANGEEILVDMIVVAIGARPVSELLEKAGVTMGNRGAVRVNQQMQTSDPDIFCIGDCVELPHLVTGDYANIQLAGPANRQAHTAAESVFSIPSVYSGCQGTAICKIFELTAAISGVSEKEIRRSTNEEIKENYLKVYANVASKVGYYPGSAPLWCKLIFHKVTGRIYGAQVIGRSDVDKRIDVLSVAIRHGLTVFQLEDLELSYAPPYNSPVDPVNMLGHIGANVIKGSHELWYYDHAFDPEKEQILDVRTVDELRGGVIPDSLHIPLDDLRYQIEKIDKSKEILVYCQSGLRGYVACRVLSDLGYRTKNLTGGWIVYSNWQYLHQ